ncbi:rhodanese-like domain-containing protein [Alkalimarinus alittae]|uniref:Rhodanese-like domain-containing protein n=1 Tax=Alkalimarinus alittae TaxID=2961619 RepID=A0ABY6N4H9_9ALTE|nr:rhodanese-like domain-containing protein [Alkalimarinus alittae]UZE97033.1 rhodanese-like domain-containing protein [Alkalimarinus alittae]
MERLFEFATTHWILASSFVGLLIALFLLEKHRSGRTISPQQATLLLNKDEGVILDVRDKKDFSEGRIKGSVHIPLASLKDRTADLEKYKDKQLVIVDKAGQHSGIAGKTLKAAGFENVCRMSGGISEWKNSSLPLVKK